LVTLVSLGRGQQLADRLSDRGWPAAFLAGAQLQHIRAHTMAAFREVKLRILVSTDLVRPPPSSANASASSS
jgi:superfamily II DNA/RNA helicase